MTSEQLEAYVVIFRINEITEQLRAKDVTSTKTPRSPSPNPDVIAGDWNKSEISSWRLLSKPSRLIAHHLTIVTKPSRSARKSTLPVADSPDVNFIGQILGPRGSSLKAMNTQSGANIVIRGRDSVKEGKGQEHATTTNHDTEPLHCLITADSQHKIDEAKRLVESVIDMATSTPEHKNERKRQLRGLAIMNGTFQYDESQDTHLQGSRLFGFSEENPNYQQLHPDTQLQAGPDKAKRLDHEYHQLMSEIEGRPLTETDRTASSVPKTQVLPPWRVNRYSWKNY
ncbi:hypothetical protein QQZ08_000218 [Neonectria magnoliae]|uniref:Branchpoint-bridging protein n=1 Tax=Neonectria magnoliae TaxID=2732573 RepID=A0ABR1IK83_9HYPO